MKNKVFSTDNNTFGILKGTIKLQH